MKMKKIFLFGFVIVAFWSCSLDDSNSEDFYSEVLPIESVSLPDEFQYGETYEINYTYLRPSTCHAFRDLYYISEGNTRTIAVINYVFSSNTNCEPLIDGRVEKTFNFHVIQETGTYIFKFWQGEDENGEDTYLVFEVPIVE
jgi:uncharacterized Rmd1/YagE family protein